MLQAGATGYPDKQERPEESTASCEDNHASLLPMLYHVTRLLAHPITLHRAGLATGGNSTYPKLLRAPWHILLFLIASNFPFSGLLFWERRF